MNKLLITLTLAALSGHTYAEQAIIGDVEDIYVEETISVPSSRMCYDVPVPIYERRRSENASGGALLGMIVGGLLGKGITNDDGGAAAGAVIGGMYGADRGANRTHDVIVDYTYEKRCDGPQTYTQRKIQTYSHSIMTYTDENGIERTVKFRK